jgi:hypothetical protein
MRSMCGAGAGCLAIDHQSLSVDGLGRTDYVISGGSDGNAVAVPRDWYFIFEQPVLALHLAHPQACAALRIVQVTAPRISRSCEHFPDGFDLHLLLPLHTV